MTVNNVNALLTYASGQTNPAVQGQEDAAQDSFDQIMTKVNDTIGGLKSELAGNAAAAAAATPAGRTAEPVSTGRKDAPAKNADQRTTSDSDRTKDATQQNGKVTRPTGKAEQKAAEEVEKSGEELVEDIAEEMDVTVEEVEEAMAVLGLTAVELFDVDNLKQLLLTISGNTDELTLVTDETLYGNLQNLLTEVEEVLADLQEDLGLGAEELDALVERIVSGQKEASVQDILPADEEPDVNLEGMKDYAVTVTKDGETVRIKVTVDDASGSKSVQEEVTDTPREAVQTSHKTREQDASADSGRGEHNAFLQTPEQQSGVEETPEPVNTVYQSPQTEEIMNQIMDYMKINLKADTQEMELQLHPASLGTVNVQIASKDGAITAQFTTQNEAVRAVLETQLIQLKEQFEEQGIKVDAVEVTVANHAYGGQSSQENGNADEKQGRSPRKARRINLDEIEEQDGIGQMEDDERIAVEMMQASGSTVDYTA